MPQSQGATQLSWLISGQSPEDQGCWHVLGQPGRKVWGCRCQQHGASWIDRWRPLRALFGSARNGWGDHGRGQDPRDCSDQGGRKTEPKPTWALMQSDSISTPCSRGPGQSCYRWTTLLLWHLLYFFLITKVIYSQYKKKHTHNPATLNRQKKNTKKWAIIPPLMLVVAALILVKKPASLSWLIHI